MKAILRPVLFLTIVIVSVSLGSEDAVFDGGQRMTEEVIAKLDSLLEYDLEAYNLPGIVVGIWIPGEDCYLKAFGTADIKTGETRLFDDPLRIASITKTFTATVVLTLVDEGLMTTSDPISTYLPQFPDGDCITVRNLLRMRSGLYDYADQTLLEDWYDHPFKNYSIDSLIDVVASHSEEFETPGTRTVYCNANYTLLAKISELVTETPFKELVDERVLRPLGMNSTQYPDQENYLLQGSNRGYSWNQNTGEFEDKTEMNTSCANAGGAIISTMNDLNIYARALYLGTLLSPETQQHRLETEVFDGAAEFMQYGEGILRIGEFYGHNGTIFGFSTEMYYLPAEDAVIVVNVNRLDLDDVSRSGKVFAEVSRIIFPEYVSW